MILEEKRRLWASNEQACVRFGAQLGAALRTGDLVCLQGDLGMGKTVVARAAIRSRLAAPAADVPSPSYTLIQTYEAPDGFEIWHVDLYRLHDPYECLELGLEEVLATGALLIEWPDRLLDSIRNSAQGCLDCLISAVPSQNSRTIDLISNWGWEDRVESLTSAV